MKHRRDNKDYVKLKRQSHCFIYIIKDIILELKQEVLNENVISQNSQENTCGKVSFLIKLQASARNFIKKETLAQMSSCELCKIFKNTFFTEHLRATPSEEFRKRYMLRWALW